MDKTELLQSMDDAHVPVAAAAKTMSDAALLDEAPGMPGWTRKDVLAHIEFWHDHSAKVLAGLRSGEDPYPAWPGSADAVNEQVLAENRDRTGTDVREGEAASFLRLRDALERATHEELFGTGVRPWLDGTAAEMIAADTFDHYPDHLASLELD